MHIRHYLATLEFVNEERAVRGLAPLDRLPEGAPGDPGDCVIARTLPGVLVGSEGVVSHRAGRSRELPPEVARFVLLFDHQSPNLREACDPATLVKGGIDDEKGCLVPA